MAETAQRTFKVIDRGAVKSLRLTIQFEKPEAGYIRVRSYLALKIRQELDRRAKHMEDLVRDSHELVDELLAFDPKMANTPAMMRLRERLRTVEVVFSQDVDSVF